MKEEPPTASDVSAARCEHHPEVAAALTCARCGSFVCAGCRSEALPTHCAPCVARLSRSRFITHVQPLGITMMVHGAFTAGLGLYYLVFGLFFAESLFSLGPTPADPSAGPSPMGGPPVDDGLFSGIVLGAFGLLAVLQVVPGALQIWAGYRARTFRSWGLALGALIAGLASSLGCYCAPTALALMVWGIVVLRDPDVRARFAASRVAGT